MLQVGYVVLGLIFASQLAFGAPTSQDEETSNDLQTLKTIQQKSETESQGLIGIVDLRPTGSFKGQDSFRFENSVDLGYQITPTFQVLYHQDFWANLYNSNLLGGPEGFGVVAQDGFLNWFQERVTENRSGSVALHYEGRLYAPTAASRREAGMITALRNYLILETKLNDVVTLNLVEAPILHAYSQASSGGEANPIFENRVGVHVRLNLSEKVRLNIPLNWAATKKRVAPGNLYSDQIRHFMWINPELSYRATENYTVGVGYYDTTSLINSDFTAFQIGEGLEDGVVQLFLKASL